MEIEIPYEPRPLQEKIHNELKRFNGLAKNYRHKFYTSGQTHHENLILHKERKLHEF